MNSDYDDLLIDFAAILAVLFVAFRANGVAADVMPQMLPIAGGLVALYFVVNAVATLWQGFHREGGGKQ